MKLSELKRIVDLSMDAKYAGDSYVMVRIRLPYATVGALPMVALFTATMGKAPTVA